MSIGYICKPNVSLAICVWDGVVTWDDWQKNMLRLFNDPDYFSIQQQIVDLRFSSIDSSITVQKLRQMSDFMVSHRQDFSLRKLALVAGEEWAKLKDFESAVKTASVDAIVFNDVLTACRWLGADAADVEATIGQIRLKLRQGEDRP